MAAMKYRKGLLIEVLNAAGSPEGSWQRGEIVAGNGRQYVVRLDHTDGGVEQFPKKRIRPCRSPQGRTPDQWVPGDEVEVFDGCFWRAGLLLNVGVGGECCSVKCFGMAGKALTFSSSVVRERLFWKDNKWVPVRKSVGYGRNPTSLADEGLPLGVVNSGLSSSTSEKVDDDLELRHNIPTKAKKRPISLFGDADADAPAYPNKRMPIKKQTHSPCRGCSDDCTSSGSRFWSAPRRHESRSEDKAKRPLYLTWS